MSVFRHGSSLLPRRLTDLYLDTKSLSEDVSGTVRTGSDPEVMALTSGFRQQKDRLLAWGLEWSDANAASESTDVAEEETARYGELVADIMSSIQELLNEAEQIQQLDNAVLVGDSKAPASHQGVKKTVWTESEVARSRDLLRQLTSYIETLHTLSASRHSGRPITSTKSASPVAPVSPRSSNINIARLNASSSTPTLSKGKGHYKIPRKEVQREKTGLQGLDNLELDAVNSLYKCFPTQADAQREFVRLFKATQDYYINSTALQIPKEALAGNASPPPYENLATPNSQIICHMRTDCIPPTTADCLGPVADGSTIPVLVQFSPLLPEIRTAHLFPTRDRLVQLHKTLSRLIDDAQVSHLGLPKFIGYYIDVPNSRYAFVYHVPPSITQSHRGLSPPSGGAVKPTPLVSLLFTPNARQDVLPPHLENRFFLAYNLALSVLHIRSQNLVHGNINSHNILVFPKSADALERSSDEVSPDFVYPYLASFAHLDNGDQQLGPEPMSLQMYRHPDDSRVISDRSAWAYDLYSLGLVLLEIGLWTPLSALWKSKYDRATFKSRLEKFYVKRLGSKCGSAYMKAVQLCLDAPNFVLSTTPMSDLSLRCTKTFTYPWSDASEANDWSVFSKNFACTITNILLRSASLDIFFPPSELDLNERLPPPLSAEPTLPEQSREPASHGGDVAESDAFDATDRTTAAPAPQDADDAEQHARKRCLKKLPDLDIPNDDLAKWNGWAMPRLSKLLQKVLRGSAESCSVSLIMAGEAIESAKPTVCVTCASVKKVRAALRRYLPLDPSWDLIVLRGSVTHSKVPRSRRPRAKSSVAAGTQGASERNPCYQKTPICGASIGAFRHDEHLPPVSYGGAVLVDGVAYGMTVHHMLDMPESEDEDEYDDDGDEDLPPRSSADCWVPSAELLGVPSGNDSVDRGHHDFLLEATDDEDDDDDDDDDESLALSFDDDDLTSDGYLSDDGWGDADDDDSDAASIGDTAGIIPGIQPPIPVTQPAFDDVEDDFFTTPDDRDDEHLAAHSFGYVYASSGLRRWTRDGIKHEVDWALIRVDEKRLEASVNIVSGVDSHARSRSKRDAEAQSIIMLDKVAKVYELGGLNVHCCGRTSGFQSGRISQAMSLLKMRGRQTFSTSFGIEGTFGVPGDSGAWVFDRATGRVCGHVLAWSERCRTAYIAPMEVLFADIARALDARSVVLPGSATAVKESTTSLHTSTVSTCYEHSARMSTPPVDDRLDRGMSTYPFPCGSSNHDSRSRSETRRLKQPARDASCASSGHGYDERKADQSGESQRSGTRASRESAGSSGSGGRGSIKGLREVAASSYHNVNALIAWQRTMMGRLPV